MQESCAKLSDEFGGEAMKKLRVFECHKWFKDGRENVEDERLVVQDPTEPMKMLKCGTWCNETVN
jgi:putative component of membrane protein insertase Oxa1/YidC/SpoIIIJ protein YidD